MVSKIQWNIGSILTPLGFGICGNLDESRSRRPINGTRNHQPIVPTFGSRLLVAGHVSAVNSGRDGRDHHPNAFTVWLAGGGIKPGLTYGETDEFGFNATGDRVHVHDLHATLLHLLGFDHEELTFRFQGLDQRLTGVEPAHVVDELLA